MTDAATIDYLNIQIRMMTEGFKEAVEEVQDGLEEIQDEVEETSDVFDDMDSRAGEIGNGIGVTLGRLSPKFGKLRQSIKQITTAFGEAGNASKLATTAMAASIAAVAAGA
ncbi:MAG: hypothetical protein IJT54_03905, partial [Candidatus Methanomethylophilaceae archaeon]|nr:hypothetical protein [Candidatus Methanomethylophilaceae archaeon]